MLAGYTVASNDQSGIPRSWAEILRYDDAERSQVVADILGLRVDSVARDFLRSAKNARLLVPNRKRDANCKSLWRLGVDTAPEPMVFSLPVETGGLDIAPGEYWQWVTTLGPFQFGPLAGYLLRPVAALELARYLRTYPHTPNTLQSFVPFFDLQTGDYDGWDMSGGAGFKRFHHETDSLDELPVNSMRDWLDMTISCIFAP